MITRYGENNIIEKSAHIVSEVIIGSHNYIGKNVTIAGFKDQSTGSIIIGDCNYIHDNTRILIGEEGLSIGDWNVFHNSMLIMGQQRMEIGHNCWFGQNTNLDSTGGLYIGNGVRVGMKSQIWTHVASGELIEGCTLFAMRPTYIEDDVWLVGSCIVGSGLRVRRRTICLIGSVITKDTDVGKVYGGIPAKQLDNLNFWKKVSLNEKMAMMHRWVAEFVQQTVENIEVVYRKSDNIIDVIHQERKERLSIGIGYNKISSDPSITYFDLENKTYSKRLTWLEREFYKFIYNHKARFLPDSDT